MTRILFWQLDDFSVSDVHGAAGAAPGFGVGAASEAARARVGLIRNLIASAEPDIIVLSGFSTDRGLSAAPGELMTGRGLDGLRLLLSLLRSMSGDAWAMTPPIRSSASDGVAMLFRRAGRFFAGPHGWSGGRNGLSTDVATAVPAAYPPDFAAFLPAGRKVPPAAPLNGGLPEAHLALRATGYTLGGGRAAFPDAFFAGSLAVRAPVLGAFAENAGGKYHRMVYIAVLRAPEGAAHAGLFNRRLAELDALEPALSGDDAIALLGSFGENIYAGGSIAPSLKPLRDRGFSDGFAHAPPGSAPDTEGFYATTLRPVDEAGYYSEPREAPLVFPAYGYARTEGPDWSVDMAFTRPAEAAKSFTVLNPVVGTPYRVPDASPAWPPQGVFTGTIPVPGQVATLQPLVVERPLTSGGVDWTAWFRSETQYAKVRAVSAHLPVAVDV
ncbi:hypothetical protein [Oceanicella sp. SM1341]|uniref:hypothetical protein n=1 Tax=Oceanicella sp. SM1341 TaxID=1548889 RepID=UPI000E4C4D05|nr:hypothetical protein [Oceanicella sp. SM1341]